MSTNAAAADGLAGAVGEDPKQVVASLNRRLGRESRWLSGNDAYFRAYIYEAATKAFDLLDVAVKAKLLFSLLFIEEGNRGEAMAAAQGFIAAAENDELSWIRALASGLRDYAGSGTWNPDLTAGSADFGKCLESIIEKAGTVTHAPLPSFREKLLSAEVNGLIDMEEEPPKPHFRLRRAPRPVPVPEPAARGTGGNGGAGQVRPTPSQGAGRPVMRRPLSMQRAPKPLSRPDRPKQTQEERRKVLLAGAPKRTESVVVKMMSIEDMQEQAKLRQKEREEQAAMAKAAKAAAKSKIHRRMLPRARATSHAKRTPDTAATGSDKPSKRPAPDVTKDAEEDEDEEDEDEDEAVGAEVSAQAKMAARLLAGDASSASGDATHRALAGAPPATQTPAYSAGAQNFMAPFGMDPGYSSAAAMGYGLPYGAAGFPSGTMGQSAYGEFPASSAPSTANSNMEALLSAAVAMKSAPPGAYGTSNVSASTAPYASAAGHFASMGSAATPASSFQGMHMFGQHMMPGSTMASSSMPFGFAQQQHQQLEQQRLLLQQRQQEQQQQQQQQLYQQQQQQHQQHQQQQQHEQQIARLLAASADHRNQEQIQQQQYRQQLQDLFQRQHMLQQQQMQQVQRQMAPVAQPAADPATAQDGDDIRTIFQDSNQLSHEHRAEILEFLRGGLLDYKGVKRYPMHEEFMEDNATGQGYICQYVFEIDFESRTWRKLLRRKKQNRRPGD